MKYSIIIPTYNHCDDLLKPCIDSIIKYTNLESDIEIIISANGCKDNTKEYVLSLGHPFKLVWNSDAIGFSRAINAGIEASTGEYVVLLNNDIILLEQEKNTWIDMLVEPFKDATVGITGPIKGPSTPANREFIIFFCCMIKREVFDKIGFLDPIFGVGGGEDTDFCIRAESSDYKTVQVPSTGPLDSNDVSNIMIGGFPIYHVGEATMHDTNCVSGWSAIFDNNSRILAERYNHQWRLGNYCERAVISKDDPVPPREHTRYTWAKENIVGTKVLEIGCSSGYGWRYFKDIPNIDYLGIDKDEGVITFAKENFGDRFKIADINTFDFEQYDTIVAFEVLEHLDNGKEIAQKLKKHCKCLLGTVPFNETPGMWGHHHKLHKLSQKDFPEFDYKFIHLEGGIYDFPDHYEGLNLILMKWEQGKNYDIPINKTVTAVIPTKGRYHTTLPLAIMSVINQTAHVDRLIIIDDGEKLDLRENVLYTYFFKLLDDKGIKWEVVFGNGKGIAHSHQLSINMCETEWIWRLDDDCSAEPNVLELLLESVDSKTGAVGGLVMNPVMPKTNDCASSKIKDIFLGLNEQWFIPNDKSIKQVDHLYSSFIYRKSAASHGYCLDLSEVGHREETIFTHEMKRNGWDIKINPNAVTHHFMNPEGGIRSYSNGSLWQHDENLFLEKLKFWNIDADKHKLIVLDNGLGDHFAFKSILNEILEKHSKIIIACCYPDVFKDYPDIPLISIASVSHADREKYNLYKFLIDNQKETINLVDAYRRLYL